MKFRLIIDKAACEEVVATVHERSALTDKIEALVLEHAGSHELTVYAEDEMLRLSFENIECIHVLDGKTYAIDTGGKHYCLKQRLYELEEILPTTFIRINKSALANENRLERFRATYSGGINACFKCGYEEYVSRRCFAINKRRYESK